LLIARCLLSTQSRHDTAGLRSPTNNKHNDYNFLYGRKKRSGEMNRRISAVIGQTSTILAALMLWGCGQQDRTTNINDTPTSNQATVPAPEDRGLSFAVTREALEQDGIADWKSISMISTQEQWLPTGLQVEADRPVTIFGFGALILDSLRLEPRNLAWVRVGEDGELIKLA